MRLLAAVALAALAALGVTGLVFFAWIVFNLFAPLFLYILA